MKEEIEFRTFELVEKNGKWEGEYLQHKVANPIKTNNNANELSVGAVWEMTPKKYMFVSITDRPHTENDYPNSLFVYEENNKIFREAKFAFEGKFRFQYVHYYSFGNTAMVRSFDFIKGEALETPVYYIDNENECIAARKWSMPMPQTARRNSISNMIRAASWMSNSSFNISCSATPASIPA